METQRLALLMVQLNNESQPQNKLLTEFCRRAWHWERKQARGGSGRVRDKPGLLKALSRGCRAQPSVRE